VEEDFDVSNAALDTLLADLDAYLKSYRQKYKSPPTHHALTLRTPKIQFKDLGKEIFQIECPAALPVPSPWRLLSSTKTVKRYWSPEIERKVRELLEARETHKTVVAEMQGRIYARFDKDYERWMGVVRAVAHVDCLVSLAGWNDEGVGTPRCRPVFVEGEGRSFVRFEELRHPCVEGYRTPGEIVAYCRVKQDFIPNDISLGGDERNLVLLTGANMVLIFTDDLTLGGQVNPIATNLRRSNNGPSRLLPPRPLRASHPRRQNHVPSRRKRQHLRLRLNIHGRTPRNQENPRRSHPEFPCYTG
jgi:DNA mismatch repair protein MSH6